MSTRVILDTLTYAIATWKKAFALFDPKELTTLLLVTAKTTGRATSLLLRYFFWLLPVCWYTDAHIGGVYLFDRFSEYVHPVLFAPDLFARVHLVAVFLLMFFTVLSVRASLEAKDVRYYLVYSPALLWFAASFLLVPHLFLVPVFILSAFFLLDGPRNAASWLRSVVNGFLAWIGYAPFLVSAGGAYGLLYNIHGLVWNIGCGSSMSFLCGAVKFSLSFVLYVFFVSLLSAFYLKVKHSNQKLFWYERRHSDENDTIVRKIKRPMKQRPAKKV